MVFLNREGIAVELSTAGFMSGNRKYSMRRVTPEQLGVMGINYENGNQYMGINLKDSSSFSKNSWGCRLAWSRLGDLGSLDPGPNPGSPTTREYHKIKAC